MYPFIVSILPNEINIKYTCITPENMKWKMLIKFAYYPKRKPEKIDTIQASAVREQMKCQV